MKKILTHRTRFNSYLDNRIYVGLELLAGELDIPKSRILDEALLMLFKSRGYELSDYEELTDRMGLDWTYFAGISEAIKASLVRCEGKRANMYTATRKDVRDPEDSPFSKANIEHSLSIVEDSRNSRKAERRERQFNRF